MVKLIKKIFLDIPKEMAKIEKARVLLVGQEDNDAAERFIHYCAGLRGKKVEKKQRINQSRFEELQKYKISEETLI